ncbi:unnamed protein product [Ranitomeya imitator]|uniref:Uncharacterized protein n=1 Tax=Ranitomeya imitator TaxID=111125 RepID=A0ABN9LPR5_9NEOB|nr:unnamed protein product [Ranitomeya imitator]
MLYKALLLAMKSDYETELMITSSRVLKFLKNAAKSLKSLNLVNSMLSVPGLPALQSLVLMTIGCLNLLAIVTHMLQPNY